MRDVLSAVIGKSVRQVARLRGEAAHVSAQTYAGGPPSTAQPVVSATASALGNTVRGTSRLRDRVEPTFGRNA